MQILSTICVAAIGAALYKILVPENKFSKQIGLLTAGVFLLIIITAFSGVKPDFDISRFEQETSEKIDDFSNEVNEQLKKEICEKTEEKIREVLSEHEIYPEEIHIIVNISGLYGIDISEIRIVLNESGTAEETAEILRGELADTVKIMVTKR